MIREVVRGLCYIIRVSDDDQYSPEETARRMERGLRRALSTPPQPHGKNPKSPPPKRKRTSRIKGRVHNGKTRGVSDILMVADALSHVIAHGKI